MLERTTIRQAVGILLHKAAQDYFQKNIGTNLGFWWRTRSHFSATELCGKRHPEPRDSRGNEYPLFSTNMTLLGQREHFLVVMSYIDTLNEESSRGDSIAFIYPCDEIKAADNTYVGPRQQQLGPMIIQDRSLVNLEIGPEKGGAKS